MTFAAETISTFETDPPDVPVGDPTDRDAWLQQRRLLEAQSKCSTPDGLRRMARTPEPLKVAICMGLRLTGMWRRGVANGLDVQLRHLVLDLPRLPAAFDGYRILHITDLHLDAAPGVAEAIVRSVEGVEVDLCALTGDFRAAENGRFTQTDILDPLAKLRRVVRASDGFFGTLGNHDCADMAAPLERIGVRMLLNETVRLRRGRQAIEITGVDDVHRFYTPAAQAALDRHDRQSFGIALVHSPELAGEAAAAGYQLYLCGHTHGGQLCLPGGRPVVKHLYRHQDLSAGLWRHGELVGYTSRGAGLSSLPVRYYCSAEVTLFTLRSSPRASSALVASPLAVRRG
ncbi:MAG: metallophosphoesterase [Geminicoccaceae bacterium]